MTFYPLFQTSNVFNTTQLSCSRDTQRWTENFTCHQKHYEKNKFALKLIRLLIISNLFSLEIVLKYILYYDKTRMNFSFRRPHATKEQSIA